MNITLNLASATATISADAKRVLANDVVFAGEYNPHNVGLFVIWNRDTAIAAVWASCEGDALDEAVDAGLMDAVACDGEVRFNEEEQGDEDLVGIAVTRLGNAGEPFYLDEVGCSRLQQADMSLGLLLAFAEARGAGAATLDDVTAAGLARRS